MVTDKEALKSFNTDWMNKYTGNSSLVLKPKSTKYVVTSNSPSNEVE